MSPSTGHKSETDRIKLAQSLYREYYARCFWHMKPDLVISNSSLPLVIKGLLKHGGKQGLLMAARLQE